MKVTVSAPGKIFLMGEHTVVYGKPALLSCINKRVTVTLNPSAKTEISSLDNKFILKLTALVKNYLNLTTIPGIKIDVVSEIKNGYHLGSSAAVSVAVIASLVYFLKKIWNPDLINKIAFEAEKIKHGTPSGADNSAVTFGGFIWYRKELDFLKNIWQIPLKIGKDFNHFYLIDTGRPEESTLKMVEMVNKRYIADKKLMENLFQQNEESTKKIAKALKEEDKRNFIDGIMEGEATLEKIGVVGKKVIPFIRKIESLRGAAKILGGGGTSSVGFILCFHENMSEIKILAEKYQYKVEPVKLGEDGIRLEGEK